MAWIKRATPVEQPVEEVPVVVEPAEDIPPVEEPMAENTPPLSRRRTKRGLRRGRYKSYAIIGLVVLFFAVIGVIATITAGVRAVQKMRDTTHLQEDMYYTLLPLAQYVPTAFDTVEEADQTPLIQAALYEITFREEIRQQGAVLSFQRCVQGLGSPGSDLREGRFW